MIETKGYAAIVNGNFIAVRTVSDSERTAMVNWMITGANFVTPHGMGEFAIKEHFAKLTKDIDVKIQRVKIILEDQ